MGPQPLNVACRWEHVISVMINLRSHASFTFVKIKHLISIKFKPISIIFSLQMDIILWHHRKKWEFWVWTDLLMSHIWGQYCEGIYQANIKRILWKYLTNIWYGTIKVIIWVTCLETYVTLNTFIPRWYMFFTGIYGTQCIEIQKSVIIQSLID